MAGLPFALDLTFFFNAVGVVVLMAVIQQDWSLLGAYFDASLQTAKEFCASIGGYINSVLQSS